MQPNCVMYICTMGMNKYSSRLDSAGMTASILCAIHCAIVPLLITILPLAGLGFLANPLIEWSMIVFALCVGTYAIGLSYLRTHHRLLPPILLVVGFLVIIIGHLFVHGWHEAIVVPIGGLLIATAHFFNFRYSANWSTAHSIFQIKHHHPHETSREVLVK
jgi:MerC mercury resistance protein